MLASLVGDTATYWLGIIGKFLLFLAGLAVLLDLIGPDRITHWKKKANRHRYQSRRHLDKIHGARNVEALTRRMARHAAREANLRPEDLQYITTEQFEAWTHAARAALSAAGQGMQRHDTAYTPSRFESSARTFVIRNGCMARFERLGLMIVDHYVHARRTRLWTIGATLFPLSCLVMVVLLCLAGERNPVLFGGMVLGAGWVSLIAWAGLQSPQVMMRLMRAESTLRLRLTQAALRLIGKKDDARPMRWAAMAAFLVGSFLDLATSLR